MDQKALNNKAAGSRWRYVSQVTAPDGFKAEIYARQGLHDAEMFGAFNLQGERLFGMQLFATAKDAEDAVHSGALTRLPQY